MTAPIRPRLPERATSQQAVLDALFEAPGEIVLAADLAARLYVEDSPEARNKLRQIVLNVRKRFPGLEIEAVLGYRIRPRRSL